MSIPVKIVQAVESDGPITLSLDGPDFTGVDLVVVNAAEENSAAVSVTVGGMELGTVAAGTASMFSPRNAVAVGAAGGSSLVELAAWHFDDAFVVLQPAVNSVHEITPANPDPVGAWTVGINDENATFDATDDAATVFAALDAFTGPLDHVVSVTGGPLSDNVNLIVTIDSTASLNNPGSDFDWNDNTTEAGADEVQGILLDVSGLADGDAIGAFVLVATEAFATSQDFSGTELNDMLRFEVCYPNAPTAAHYAIGSLFAFAFADPLGMTSIPISRLWANLPWVKQPGVDTLAASNHVNPSCDFGALTAGACTIYAEILSLPVTPPTDTDWTIVSSSD